jgi:hypothetical protein
MSQLPLQTIALLDMAPAVLEQAHTILGWLMHACFALPHGKGSA